MTPFASLEPDLAVVIAVDLPGLAFIDWRFGIDAASNPLVRLMF
jgi:hypothetical protein